MTNHILLEDLKNNNQDINSALKEHSIKNLIQYYFAKVDFLPKWQYAHHEQRYCQIHSFYLVNTRCSQFKCTGMCDLYLEI